MNNTATPSGVTQNIFTLDASASWEIDLFGGKRRENEAANADLAETTKRLAKRDPLVVRLLARLRGLRGR